MGKLDIVWAPWRLSYVTAEAGEKVTQEPNRRVIVGGDPNCFLCQAAVDSDNADRFVVGQSEQTVDSDNADHFGVGQSEQTVDSDNADRFVVGQSEQTLAILNRFPYNNGHLLLAPKRHLATLNVMSPELRAELAEQLNFWVDVLEAILHPEGFNVGLNLGRVAGAGLPGHLHWHIVPRWNGDTNFMTAISETKVIPQSLQALAEIIRDKIAHSKI